MAGEIDGGNVFNLGEQLQDKLPLGNWTWRKTR